MDTILDRVLLVLVFYSATNPPTSLPGACTYRAIMRIVQWSFDAAAHGLWPQRGPFGEVLARGSEGPIYIDALRL